MKTLWYFLPVPLFPEERTALVLKWANRFAIF